MVRWCQTIENKPWFHFVVIAVIILNAALLGLETSQDLHSRFGGLFNKLHWTFQVLFMLEILIRILGAQSLVRFFADGWNVFDFVVVGIALIPEAGATATIARLARVVRVARLVEILPDSRLIIATMLRSMRSMTNVIALIGFLLYTYAIIGCHMFHEADPEHWGTLHRSMWSLFQTMTIEAWVDQQSKVADVYGCWLFYASFLIVAVYGIVNLFVAVVVNNLQEIKMEHQEKLDDSHDQAELLQQIDTLRTHLARLESQVRKMKS